MASERTSSSEPWANEARRVARAVRRRVLEQALRQGGGYLSQACSSAEILATLYTRLMRLGPREGPALPPPFAGVPGPSNPHACSGARYNGPRAPELDRFFFSPVHYALALYATLIELGRLGAASLDQLGEDGSTLELIGAEHSPGHEVTAGSLAQALSVAGGVALGRRLHGETGRCWVFLSDGELQEGQSWEALQALRFHRLDSLSIVVDANGHQCDGRMDRVMGTEPLLARLQAFGADAVQVDGHDVEALAAAATRPAAGQPRVVVARTDPCRGIEALRQRSSKIHHVRFSDEAERARFRAELDRLAEED